MRVLLGVFAALLLTHAAAAAAESCAAAGRWADAVGAPINDAAVLRIGAAAPVVVLGEIHESADDHRWQLQTLAGLYAAKPQLVIGMEAFPRRLQPVLDRWSAGEIDEAAFLQATEWNKIWGYDPAHYLPILHFARMRRLPLIALNVERSLVSRVAKEGWAAIPADAREGVGEPASVSAGYRNRLAAVAAKHGGEPDQTALNRFIDAQSLWDRAMAEAAAAALRRYKDYTVVAIVGRGHGENRDGMIWQLAHLGLGEAQVWMTWKPGDACNTPDVRIADALFGLDATQQTSPPRLGILTQGTEKGLAVVNVAPGSIAAAAGLRPGDVVIGAGGKPIAHPGDLTALARSVPPGAWLPLEIRRGGGVKTVTAKFPPQ